MKLNDLPEIKVLRHAQAKRLRLRVEPNGIRLTVPLSCSQKQIQAFIDQSTDWLWETWQQQQQKLAAKQRDFPQQLRLFNLDQTIEITIQTQRQNFYFDPQRLELCLSDRASRAYLKAFVIDYAKQHLPDYLAQVSQQCALHFQHCNIRQPKTRWGSCSSRHDIMLNAALVLYPAAVVRYVCVHELAHTQHFDHSARFWALVQQHDIDFQQHRKLLKTTALPDWWTAN